jgi:hypothetical protein
MTKLTCLAIRELVLLLKGGARHGGCHLLLKVQGHIGQLLLDIPDNLTLGRGGEGIPPLCNRFPMISSSSPPFHLM